jgi:hypothetical protein
MGTENVAYGASSFPDVQRVAVGAGLKTDFALLLPPTGRIAAYVRHTAVNGDPQEIEQRRFTTLASALKQCRPGQGDVVAILPGHTENVVDANMLTNLVDGTTIVGMGSPRQDNAPTFRWTTTSSKWLISKKNVTIQNLRLRLEGANNVVKAIEILGVGTTLAANTIEVASAATFKAAIAIEVGTGAHDTTIQGNAFYGTATHSLTHGINVVGAAPPQRLRVTDNEMQFSSGVANGCINVGVAALQLLIARNIIYNTMTGSTAAINLGAVASDGIVANNYVGILTNGVASATGIVTGATSLVKCFQNFCADEPRASGVLSPVAVAT